MLSFLYWVTLSRHLWVLHLWDVLIAGVTIELENGSSVSFLNTSVIRSDDNVIQLDWYQKPTSPDIFVNFHSNNSLNQKYNTVMVMKNPVTHISHQEYFKLNLNKLFRLFANNWNKEIDLILQYV